MGLFRKAPKPAAQQSAVSQIVHTTKSFNFNHEAPYAMSLGLIDHMRSALPILNVIPKKWVSLIGSFEFECDNPRALEFLNTAFKTIKVNGQIHQGFDIWQDQFFDSVIAKGHGTGEGIPYISGRGLARLENIDAAKIAFIPTDDGSVLGQYATGLMAKPFEKPEYIYHLSNDLVDGSPRGRSIFYGMPFMVQILERLYKCIDNISWRVGEPTYLVVVSAGPDTTYQDIQAAVNDFKAQNKEIMQEHRQGKPGDIFTGAPYQGEVSVSIMGKEGHELLDKITVPAETVLDQVVTGSELPGWMLNVTKTEGMNSNRSDNEADMVTGKVWKYRTRFEPIIDRVFGNMLIGNGFTGVKWGIKWDEVSLKNEKDQAIARLNNAKAEQTEILDLLTLIENGMISQDQVDMRLERMGFKGLDSHAWATAQQTAELKKLSRFVD